MQNRRNFLKYLGLAGGAFTLPAAVTATPGINESGIYTLKGKVHSNGKGIAGVAVTDGVTVTTTKADGSYSFAGDKAARFVYISIPAGYEFPVDNGCAVYYVPITKKEGVFNADFKLNKLAVSDKKHAFVVWADTQIISKEDANLLLTQSAPDLKQLVAGYPAGTLMHGIGCGDLVWDHFELFEDYRQALKIAGIPFFNVIGNHDMDLDARTDDHSSDTFQKQFGPTYYSYNRGDIHYITLDDVFFIGKNKEYIGYVTENQLRWLEQDLALVKEGSTVVVSLHIPVESGAARRNNKKEELGGTVSNRKELYRLLSKFQAHIMSGHTHINEKVEMDNRMIHVHGTVCGAWWTGPICTDGSPNGYAVYEVDGSELKWYYKSTGKPKDHQLRVYPRGKVADKPDEVAANVWNWDPKWKIEWFEDGVNKGLMEQRVGLDPLAVELHLGAALPSKHPWVDPTLTDHLFYCTPSKEAKEIKVKATDRFGNVYMG
ncbi:MAG: calcineurin-like phosphoesterase family protein [Flavitalea sp.]